MANVGAEFATRLSTIRQLSPPVGVEDLARKYADVSFETLPSGFSGLALWLKDPLRKPEIVIDKAMVVWRQRFTIAHELGHVIIPWHVGNIIDSHLEDFLEQASSDIEREADAFAAELLCPELFTRRALVAAGNYALAHQHIATTAEISGRAAAFRIMDLVDDCLVIEHSGGRVTWAMRAHGLSVARPLPSEPAADIAYRSALDVSSCRIRSSNYKWWKFPLTAKLPAPSIISWRKILDDILDAGDPADKASIKRTISGIFGAANAKMTGNDPERLAQILLERFDARAELAWLVAHPRFMEFLSARTHEITARK